MSTFSPRSRSSGKAPRGRAYRQAGFTLIELMVVLAIVTILTAVFLFQQKRFDSSTLLRSLAYSIALSVRQAQIYGTSVRQFGSSFSYNYGVYFTKSGLSCTNGNNCYILFADANNDKLYTSSPDEKVQLFNLSPGYSIKTFCGISGTSMDCSAACPATLPLSVSSCNANAITWLSVYFKRPNPDALFAASSGSSYSSGYVQIVGPTGGTDTRSITITDTGQISVGAFGS